MYRVGIKTFHEEAKEFGKGGEKNPKPETKDNQKTYQNSMKKNQTNKQTKKTVPMPKPPKLPPQKTQTNASLSTGPCFWHAYCTSQSF